jgi:beta-1,4-N-acetylglucosaminyltransferase
LKLALITSTGGHLLQMMNLRDAWESQEHFFVTFPLEDAKTLLDGETVYWAHHQTNRSIKNLLKNAWLAWKVLRKERPDVVISTGAALAVPFLWLGRLMGMRTVYLESISRVHTISMTGKMILPTVDKFYGQWEELTSLHPKIEYDGRNI